MWVGPQAECVALSRQASWRVKGKVQATPASLDSAPPIPAVSVTLALWCAPHVAGHKYGLGELRAQRLGDLWAVVPLAVHLLCMMASATLQSTAAAVAATSLLAVRAHMHLLDLPGDAAATCRAA